MRVRALREAEGLSQEKLAEVTGMSRNYLGGIERGEENPSLGKVTRIAKALGLTLSDLFRGVQY